MEISYDLSFFFFISFFHIHTCLFKCIGACLSFFFFIFRACFGLGWGLSGSGDAVYMFWVGEIDYGGGGGGNVGIYVFM